MSGGILRFPWTSQPQTPVGVDWGKTNPSAVVLCTNHAPRIFARGLADNVAAATGTGIFLSPSVNGIGAGSDTSSTNTFRLNALANQTNTVWESPSSQVTVMVFLTRTGSSAGQSPVFSNADTGLTSTWGIQQLTSTIRFDCNPSGGARTSPTASINVGETAVFFGRYDGSVASLFKNGTSVGSSASTSGNLVYVSASDRGPTLGNYYNFTGTARSFVGRIYMGAVWNRALSDAEIKALSDNPWQLFAPIQRTIWVPAAGGGGSHATTGALSASAATIAGAATHLTLHTTSGALAASDATIAGSANRSTTHPTSGALVASDAIITGTAAHLTLHTSSGGLVAGDAALAGAAEHSAPGTHVTSGALTADAAVIAGSATHLALHTASGALVADSASIAGTALHTPIHAASGGLVAGEGALLGIALRTPAPTAHDASGGLVAGAAVISGLATGPALPFFSVSGGGIKPTHHKKPAPTLFDEELKAPTTKLKKAAVPSFTPSTFVPYAKMAVPKALFKALGEVIVGPISAPPREALPPEFDDDDIPDEVIMLALQ